jgi:hypothetical protein
LGGWERTILDREKRRMPAAQDEAYEEEKGLRKEGELIKNLRDVEIVGVIPVKACRITASGAGAGAEKKGGSQGKGGGKRGGRGSKKAR